VTVSNATLADNSHLSTGEGNITFNGTLALPSVATTQARFYLQSEHGNIDVTLPADTNVTLDTNTNVGKITSDFPINVQDQGGGSQSYHGPMTPSAAPSAASLLILDVSTGNVTIHKA
jgi:predicted membrane protein